MEALTERLMGLFAEALGVQSDFFKDKIDKHVTNLVALRYPPVTAASVTDAETVERVKQGPVYSSIPHHDDAPHLVLFHRPQPMKKSTYSSEGRKRVCVCMIDGRPLASSRTPIRRISPSWPSKRCVGGVAVVQAELVPPHEIERHARFANYSFFLKNGANVKKKKKIAFKITCRTVVFKLNPAGAATK